MPYNQFMANAAGELAAQVTDTLQNDTAYSQTVSYSLSVSDRASGSVLCSDAPTLAFLPGYQAKQVSDPLAISVAGLPTYPANTKVTFRSTYSMISTPATGVTANDTIVKDQVFDNYLAYDDGTAEKSYYLNLFPTLDGRIAIEYHLNEPDTLRGLAIYFGKQLPYPTYKTFNMFVYSSLAGVNGALADAPIDSQEFQVPFYSDTQDHFWVYTFDNPLVLPAGTFYAGTQQPAASGDDSLYFGLDVNRVGSNHAYFRVLDVWEPSLISGAIMIRPILGRHVIGNGITSVTPAQPQWTVMPDPAKDVLQFQFEGDKQADYYITDVSGHTVLQGIIFNDKTIDISGLVPGLYLVNLMHNGVAGAPQKIIKL